MKDKLDFDMDAALKGLRGGGGTDEARATGR